MAGTGAARGRDAPWPGDGTTASSADVRLRDRPAHPDRIATVGEDLVVVPDGGSDPIAVVWPSGWAAWRLDGRAELVTRDGRLIGREGDLIEGFGGGVSTDDRFHVCDLGV